MLGYTATVFQRRSVEGRGGSQPLAVASHEVLARMRPLSIFTGLSACGLALLAACSPPSPANPGGAQPDPAVLATRAAAIRAEEIPTESPSEAEPLASASYGIQRSGDNLTPTMTLRDVRCEGTGTMDLTTSEGHFLLQIPAFPGWTCKEASDQLRAMADGNVTGITVGIIYDEGQPGEQPQANVILGNGRSVTYAVHALYRTA